MSAEVTFGVEEEYLLLDEKSWQASPRADRVRAVADHLPGLGRHEVDDELLQALVEVATPVCTELDEAAAHLERYRTAVSEAARRTGCRMAATGGAPLSSEAVPVTQKQ